MAINSLTATMCSILNFQFGFFTKSSSPVGKKAILPRRRVTGSDSPRWGRALGPVVARQRRSSKEMLHIMTWTTHRRFLVRFLNEPLVRFMILGAVIFALQALFGKTEAGEDLKVEISSGQIKVLRAAWVKKRGRPPSEAELRNIVDGRLREEIFYREAIRMGLDQDDVIVRRRLAQKLEFLVQNLTIPNEPPEQDLRTFFAGNAQRYREAARLSFSHVYFSIDRRPEAAKDAETLLRELRAAEPPPEHAPRRGDPFMSHYHQVGSTFRDASKNFGRDFARALFELEPDGWQGPLRSAYGMHLVRIYDKRPPRDVELEEVRKKVVRDWRSVRRREANAETYARLSKRYEISVADFPGSGDGRPAPPAGARETTR